MIPSKTQGKGPNPRKLVNPLFLRKCTENQLSKFLRGRGGGPKLAVIQDSHECSVEGFFFSEDCFVDRFSTGVLQKDFRLFLE